MSEKNSSKKVKKICVTWDEAKEQLLKYGYCDINTGGGKLWNEDVRQTLEEKMKCKVIFVGASPGEHHGKYRYSLELKTNKDAKSLLSETLD